MSFVDPTSDWYFASVHVIIHEISYNIRLHYNGTRPYLLQICEWWYIHVLPSYADIIQNKSFKLLVGFLVIITWRMTRECFGEWVDVITLITRFMGPTWGPPGSCRPQVGRMLAPWTLLSGKYCILGLNQWLTYKGINSSQFNSLRPGDAYMYMHQ